MSCGAHHHLKRLAAPTQWSLDKKNGKYAVRPLPGPHNKEISIPLKYIIARFLKVANTAKEVEYIANNKMIAINGKDVSSVKFPVGMFDVITVKKTNQHFLLYFGANGKFKLHKISSGDAKTRISKVVSQYVNKDDSIPMTHTLDGYNFKFVDPAVKPNDTVVVDIATNKVVSHLKFEAGKIGYVFSGPHAGRIGEIKYLDKPTNGKESAFLQDVKGKSFSATVDKVMVIGEGENRLVPMEESDGVRLNAFEISNLKYAVEEEAEVENN